MYLTWVHESVPCASQQQQLVVQTVEVCRSPGEVCEMYLVPHNASHDLSITPCLVEPAQETDRRADGIIPHTAVLHGSRWNDNVEKMNMENVFPMGSGQLHTWCSRTRSRRYRALTWSEEDIHGHDHLVEWRFQYLSWWSWQLRGRRQGLVAAPECVHQTLAAGVGGTWRWDLLPHPID
jgi:hypothetical protein